MTLDHFRYIAFAAVLFFVNAIAANNNMEQSKSCLEIGPCVDAIVRAENSKRAGIVVAIFQHGNLLYAKGYGFRDFGLPEQFQGEQLYQIMQTDDLLNLPRKRVAPNVNTLFSIGSVSKQFTAGAILLLHQRGKLSIYDPVSKYFPNFPQGDQISLLYLMQHLSGIPDYNNFPDFSEALDAFEQNEAGPMKGWNLDIIERRLEDLINQSGKELNIGEYAYSNSNYLLLALIIQKVSGKPLAVFLKNNIFMPLQMTSTHQGYPKKARNVALGYSWNEDISGNKLYRAYAWDLNWLAGCGGLTSTVLDLEKWDQAVSRPGLFTEETLALMFKPEMPSSDLACGWVVESLNGHRYVWHNGQVGGFRAMNATFPDDDVQIIILTNQDNLSIESLIPPLFHLLNL